jgi:hypothetical protein
VIERVFGKALAIVLLKEGILGIYTDIYNPVNGRFIW